MSQSCRWQGLTGLGRSPAASTARSSEHRKLNTAMPSAPWRHHFEASPRSTGSGVHLYPSEEWWLSWHGYTFTRSEPGSRLNAAMSTSNERAPAISRSTSPSRTQVSMSMPSKRHPSTLSATRAASSSGRPRSRARRRVISRTSRMNRVSSPRSSHW